jgi:hypothetical protein
MYAFGHGEAHQRVPGRVELDRVAAVAIAVEGLQHRRIAVGLEAPFDGLGPAAARAEGAEPLLGPTCPFAGHRLLQRAVAAEEVVVDEGRRLVEDLVGGEALAVAHDWISFAASYRRVAGLAIPC